MSIAKFSKCGRITIPKEIRDGLGLLPGDTIDFQLQSKHHASLRNGRGVTPDSERWLHTPEAKRALTEGLAWAATTPARASDLSAFQKIIAGRGSATKQSKTKP